MSIAPLSSIWTQSHNGQTSSAASATGSQSASDWLTNLMSATGSAGSADSSNLSTATMSDQMQALLVQLQGGNTSAPVAATASINPTGPSAGAASPAATGAGASHGHHHHQHGASSVDQNANDLFTNVAADLEGGGAATQGSSTSAASATASSGNGSGGSSDWMAGMQQFAGTLMTNVQQALQTYGAAALKAGATGAVMAAV